MVTRKSSFCGGSFTLLFFAFVFLQTSATASNRPFEILSHVSVAFSGDFSQVYLSFSAFQHHFKFSLVQYSDLFDSSKSLFASSFDERLLRRPITSTVFRGLGKDSLKARVDFIALGPEFVDVQSPLFNGFFEEGNNIFVVEPYEDYLRQRPELARSTIKSTQLVAYRMSDQMEHVNLGCGFNSHHGHDHHENEGEALEEEESRTRGRRAVQDWSVNNPSIFPPPAPCTKNLTEVLVSFAADRQYMSVFDNDPVKVQAEIKKNLLFITAVFEKTVNVKIVLSQFALNENADWNTPSCPGEDQKLERFSKWRDTQSREDGIWHLLTNCYPSGQVGLAWTSAACLSRGFQGKSGYVNGVGLSSYLKGLNGWRVIAHEIGHGLGASHTDEGLMNPRIGPVDQFSRGSQNEMCGLLGSGIATCLRDPQNCVRNCTGKACGSDGCGGICGSCKAHHSCIEDQCRCIPFCAQKECGSDGCGKTCGSCKNGTTCDTSVGLCEARATKDWREQVEKFHNAVRRVVGLPPVKYNISIEHNIEKYFKCNNSPSSPSSRPGIGENVYTSANPTIMEAMKSWYDQKKNWVCQTNECRGTCGKYFRMVEQSTTEIGCAMKDCKTHGKTFVCWYSPSTSRLDAHPFNVSLCVDCPLRCKYEGMQCGTVFNGCFDEFCGSCPIGSECQSGQCVCIPQTSCKIQNRECGKISLGCNQHEDCGSCPAGKTCSPLGRCVCDASTCGRLQNSGKICGTSTSGCGTFSCGTCNNGTTCSDDGQSCLNPNTNVKCVPTTSCKQQNKTCGKLFDGCSMEECGTCEQGSQCLNNQCACVPIITCANRSTECGRLWDGCSLVRCGLCRENAVCQNGKCVECSTRCHRYATCGADKKCLCSSGFRGDGVSFCNPVGDLDPNSGFGKVTFVKGSLSTWYAEGDQVSHMTNDTTDLFHLDPSYIVDSRTRTQLTWRMRRTSADSTGGAAFLIQDEKNFAYFKIGEGNQVLFGVMRKGLSNEFSLPPFTGNPHYGSFVTLTVSMEGHAYRFQIGNETVRGEDLVMNPGWGSGGIGFFAKGLVDFAGVETKTLMNVTISVSQCITTSVFRQSLAKVMRKTDGDWLQVQSKCKQQKRDLEQSQDQTGSYDVTFSGDKTSSAITLATQMQAEVNSDSPELRQSGLLINSYQILAANTNATNSFPLNEVDESSGLSTTGIILVIVFLLLAGGVIALVFVLYMKQQKSTTSYDKEKLYY